MKRHSMLFFLCGLVMAYGQCYAQSFYYKSPERPWAMELGVGPAWTLADNSFPGKEATFKTSYSGSLGLTKNFNGNVGLRTVLGFQKFKGNAVGDFQDRIQLNELGNAVRFYGYSIYGDISPVYNYGYRKFYNSKSHLNLYSSMGLGTMGVFSDQKFQVRESKTKGNHYSKMLLFVPIRTGVSYRFLPLWELSLEGGFHWTFNDRIDGRVGANKIDDHFITLQSKVRKLFAFDY
jgi:hypothetical protein